MVVPAFFDAVGDFFSNLASIHWLALLCPPGVARRVLDLAGTLDTFAAYSSAEALEAALVPPSQ